jgi:hypothetical protein
MADNNGRLHDLVGFTTDFSVLLREICVVALFCLLFFWPDTFKTLLTRIGISKVSTVFGDIDVSETGGTVANLNRGLSDTITRLQQIQSSSAPTSKTDIQGVTDVLKDLQQQAQTADESIKSTLVSQQAASGATTSTKVPGWIFIGSVDKDKQHWVGTSTVPSTLSPNLTVGEKFNLTTATYLRATGPAANHAAGKVIGVVRASQQVDVIAPPVCQAEISGGFFCWVEVQPL